MTSKPLPDTHVDLLDRPLYGHLATIRPDGAPQSSVMWYAWDGDRIRMTHKRTRQKFQNFQHQPRVAMTIADPDDPLRSLEVRGVVESVEPDMGATLYRALQERYGKVYEIKDAVDRVVVTIRPESYVPVVGGRVVRG